ncbi:hypothetical protein PAXRUDRAFT_178033, partial [Paxillus rubicundulus Ve08.2h10]
ENETHFGEVQYFARLAVQEGRDEVVNDEDNDHGHGNGNFVFADVVVLQMYSMPDVQLLQQSSQVVPVSTLLDDVLVIGIKSIISIVAMVPHTFTMPSREEKDGFFMVEKLGLNISNLGVPYSVYDDHKDDGDGDDVE